MDKNFVRTTVCRPFIGGGGGSTPFFGLYGDLSLDGVTSFPGSLSLRRNGWERTLGTRLE